MATRKTSKSEETAGKIVSLRGKSGLAPAGDSSPVVRPWPRGNRCACLFTFDLDAEVAWVFRGSNDPIALSMGRLRSRRSACRCSLTCSINLGIKSTFFVPGWVARNTAPPSRISCVAGTTSSITATCTSRREHSNRRTRRKSVSQRDRNADADNGRRPRAYRSPFWEFSAEHHRALEKHGFEYTGDLMDTLLPDYHVVDGRTTT